MSFNSIEGIDQNISRKAKKVRKWVKTRGQRNAHKRICIAFFKGDLKRAYSVTIPRIGRTH